MCAHTLLKPCTGFMSPTYMLKSDRVPELPAVKKALEEQVRRGCGQGSSHRLRHALPGTLSVVRAGAGRNERVRLGCWCWVCASVKKALEGQVRAVVRCLSMQCVQCEVHGVSSVHLLSTLSIESSTVHCRNLTLIRCTACRACAWWRSQR